MVQDINDLYTSGCCSQCAIGIIPVPVGCFVKSSLDIVHEPKHLGSRCSSLSQNHTDPTIGTDSAREEGVKYINLLVGERTVGSNK